VGHKGVEKGGPFGERELRGYRGERLYINGRWIKDKIGSV